MIMKLISQENLILNEGFALTCLEDDILEWEGEVMCQSFQGVEGFDQSFSWTWNIVFFHCHQCQQIVCLSISEVLWAFKEEV